MKKDKSSILAFIIAIPLVICLLASSVSASKLYTGGEKYEKNGVIALTLTLNGKLIEWVYKENLSQCLKSKRVAAREVGGERVIFACKSVKGLLQEDKQAKYGIRLLKILN
jgi:anaerobic C4-dicarboxylate transporter